MFSGGDGDAKKVNGWAGAMAPLTVSLMPVRGIREPLLLPVMGLK